MNDKNYDRAGHRAGRSMTMTEKNEELIAEARRWANGHPNRRSGELMRDLAEALAALTSVLCAKCGEIPVLGKAEDLVVCMDCAYEMGKDGVRAALTAAGVAPQGPRQNETKSGEDFVSLDPEKVAEVLNRHEPIFKDGQYAGRCICGFEHPSYSGWRLHRARALCEAAKRGDLS